MLWEEEAIQRLVLDFGLSYVSLDMCQFGTLWKKLTKLLVSTRVFRVLERRCTRDHPHVRPRGNINDPVTCKYVAQTALAAAYPASFCTAYASCVDNLLRVAPISLLGGNPEEGPGRRQLESLLPSVEASGRSLPEDILARGGCQGLEVVRKMGPSL
jgi:hypothetical protein